MRWGRRSPSASRLGRSCVTLVPCPAPLLHPTRAVGSAGAGGGVGLGAGAAPGFQGGDKTKRRWARARLSQGHTEVVAASPPALRPRHCQPRGHEAAEASKPKAIGKAPGEEAGAGGGWQGKASAVLPFAPRAPVSRLKIMRAGELKLLSPGKAQGERHQFPCQATVRAGERQSSDPAHTGPCLPSASRSSSPVSPRPPPLSKRGPKASGWVLGTAPKQLQALLPLLRASSRPADEAPSAEAGSPPPHPPHQHNQYRAAGPHGTRCPPPAAGEPR